MKITYTSSGYSRKDVVAKYIGVCPYGTITLYEVNSQNLTIREATVEESEVPADKLEKARALQGKLFNQVKL